LHIATCEPRGRVCERERERAARRWSADGATRWIRFAGEMRCASGRRRGVVSRKLKARGELCVLISLPSQINSIHAYALHGETTDICWTHKILITYSIFNN
jgi:hypothetical protein